MTMNINTAPEIINRSSVHITPGYMSGFGNSFETEALPGALPMGRNSPQRCAYGLYAEQLSGSPFTAPRGSNERSWLYRIRPSVKHSGRFAKVDAGLWRTAPCFEQELSIAQLRWDPAPIPKEEMTFLQGVQTMTTAGDANTQAGMAAHVYLVTKSMVDQHFYNADGEMMFVAQQGNLRFVTEFGRIDAEPGEIVLIPRGVKFRVEILSGPARGYICENYGGAFTLPERGPIGANCLANARDFLTPVAAYEDKDTPTELFVKWGGALFVTRLPHSPVDVVAWHGNYAPYKYDLRTFSPVGAIGFDHPDPSIFTVLTRSEEHTSELQSRQYLVCRLLLAKKNIEKTLTVISKHDTLAKAAPDRSTEPARPTSSMCMDPHVYSARRDGSDSARYLVYALHAA